MFRSLSSKNRHGSSGTASTRKKTESTSRRRTESVASSSSHRKQSRNDEGSESRGKNPPPSLSAYQSTDGSSNPSSYYTAPDLYDRAGQNRTQSLTENAIRTLGMREEAWEDDEPRVKAFSGEQSKEGRKHQSSSSSREHIPHRDKRTIVDEPRITDRSLNSQFPGQFPQSAPEHQTNSYFMSSHVQDQFPGQDPLAYSAPAFNQGNGVGHGLAADYYSGQSLPPNAAQPGSRPEHGSPGYPGYSVPNSAVPSPMNAPGNNSAAEYYSGTPLRPSVSSSVPQEPSQFPATTGTKPTKSDKPSKSSKPSKSEKSSSSSSAVPTANAATLGYGASNLYQSSASFDHQQNTPAPYDQHMPDVPMSGHATSQDSYHNHSQSMPPMSTPVEYYAPPPSSRPSKSGKQPSQTNGSLYTASAAGMAAGAYALHNHDKYHHPSIHNHSASLGVLDSKLPYSSTSPSPYMNGNMAIKHQHKGPISKFVDWWKDHEDVRKMEEYTEYIGVCKYCFDPRSSVAEAPRNHHYGGRRSMDSQGRRSSESLRRSYVHGSKVGRVDKDARYFSSDNERRRKKTSWLGSGLAGYGLAKMGKSLWQNSRDFDDTYSVKSGRRDDVSRTSSRKHKTRNHSPDRMSRSEKGVLQRDDLKSSYTRSKTGPASQHHAFTERSRSSSRSRNTGAFKAAAGASMGASAIRMGSSPGEDQIHVRHPSLSPERSSISAAVRRRGGTDPRTQSPSLGEIFGLTSSKKRQPSIPRRDPSRSSTLPRSSVPGILFPNQHGQPKKTPRKKNSFFTFANSSASSNNSDLAFGNGYNRSDLSSRKAPRSKSDEKLNATLLGIGATAAAIAAAQKGTKHARRRSEVLAVRERRDKKASRDRKTPYSKQTSSGDDAWESASENDAGSVSSGLAFGDFDVKGKSPARPTSSESISSQSSGTNKWSWRWRNKPDKKRPSVTPPPAYPPRLGYVDPNVFGRPSGDENSGLYSQSMYGEPIRRTASVESYPTPLQYVQPMPVADSPQFGAIGPQTMPGAFPEQPSLFKSRPDPIQLQQPQPVNHVQPGVFASEDSSQLFNADQSGSNVFTRPQPPTGLRRTQSSPITSHIVRDVAIVGLASAATAGILSSRKNRSFKEESPSGVRFDLTEKQAKKEERERHKEVVKESKERKKADGVKETKERRRADRERALKEEAERQSVESRERERELADRRALDRKSTEEDDAPSRREAIERAREQEADIRRQKEIEDYMRDALAAQARDAELRQREEAQQSYQQPIQQQQDPRTPWDWGHANHGIDIDRRQKELDDRERDHNVSDVWAASAAGGVSGAAIGAVLDDIQQRDRRDHDAESSYKTRSLEPSNEHNGRPLMDDDLHDPSFFSRNRGQSDCENQEITARNAAAKVISDLEDRYRDPTPSQSEFFAPKELSMPSKGKTKVHDPDGGNDVQVYRVPGIEHTNEPPPPYQASPNFPGSRDDKGDQPRWGIPQLIVIAPTPPTSHAGSVKSDRSPVIVSQAEVDDVKDRSDASAERRRANRVSWGEDQTRVYMVQTPESSQEQFDPYREPKHGHSALRNEIVDDRPSSEEASPSNYTTDRPQSSRNGNEFIEEITREQANMNPGGFYQYPFAESVSDLGFVLDSPGTEGAPPVKGYVEGEIDGPTPTEYQMPHVPGGFDDGVIDSPRSTNGGAPDKAQSTNGSYFGLDMAQESGNRNVDAPPDAKTETFSSKKEKRRKDKAARRGLDDEAVSSPTSAPEVNSEPEDDSQWPLSKKEQKKRAKAAKRALYDFDAPQSSNVAEDTLETRSVFSEPARTDDVPSKTERRKHKTEQLELTTPSPSTTVAPDDSQWTNSVEPADFDQSDYFLSKKERKKRDKAAKRASLGEENLASTPLRYEEQTTQKPAENQDWSNQREKAEAGAPLDRELIEEPRQASTKEYQKERVGGMDRSGYGDIAAAALAGVVAAAPLITERRQSPIRRKSEPHEIESRRDTSPASTSRDSGSKSTPTSPTENRRPSIPGHAFDDLDMTSGSMKPKAKRNSIFNSPTVGSPLRSAMTWEDYVGPIEISPTEKREETPDSKELEVTEGAESPSLERSSGGPHSEEERSFSRTDFPSPESERGALSVASAPAERSESGRRHKSKHSRHGDDEHESRRSRSVAASEPADAYESSRKHKRQSDRDSGDFDDTASVASARSYNSKHDDAESSKSKKKGGILSLFRRKSVDSAPRAEDVKDKDQEGKSKKRHHRRRSSERGLDDDDRRSSTSRSRPHDEDDLEDTRSQHSSSSKTRRRNHRDGSVDDDALSQASESRRRHKHRHREEDPLPEKDFDDSRSATSESKRKHKHRHRDRSNERQRSPSRDSRSHREEDKDAKERDQSFLGMRVEDEESRPLPADATSPPSQASEPVETFNISASSPIPESLGTREPSQTSNLQNTSEEPAELDQNTLQDHADVEVRDETPPVSTEHAPSPPYSPTLEGITPRRIPLRVNSSTSVPLRFRYPPTSPGVQHERSSSFSSPVAQSPTSPITPRSRHSRPGSTEFTSSTEFRPLYLLESTRKPQESEKEEPLPSLPSSRTTSRASSLPSSDEWQSAAEEIEPSEQGDPKSPADVDLSHEMSDDVLGSQQTTPKATEFPPNVLDVHPRAEPEYYSWSDIEREERMHEEEAKQQHSERRNEEPFSQHNPVALPEPQIERSTEASNTEIQSASDTGNIVATALAAVTGATVGWLATMAHGPEESDKAPHQSDAHEEAPEEAPNNHDPLASDVWGDLSDNARDDPAQTSKNEYLWPTEQSTTPETSTPSRTGSIKKGKGEKKAKLPKLGTASVSGPVAPVRDSPEELRRRRQQDAQDAMETWFDPVSETAQAESSSASQIALPQTPNILAEDEVLEDIPTPALAQESARSTSLDNDSSLLLTRKKSKKGKKKQKANSSQRPSSPEETTQKTTGRSGDGEPLAAAFKPSSSDVVGHLATDTLEKAHIPEQVAGDVDSILPGEAFTSEAIIPIDDAQQASAEIKAEELVTPLSKAERKKQKKARKAGPLVEESSETPRETGNIAETKAPVIEEDLDTVPVAPASVTDEAAHSTSRLTQDKPRSPYETPQMPLSDDVMASKELHASLTQPEQLDLPGGIDDDLDRPSREISDSDFAAVVLPPSYEFLHAERFSVVNDGQARSSLEPEAIMEPAMLATVETPEEESSWFSWLPGGKKKKGKKSRKGSPAPESLAVDPTIISQEPFERLLDQTPSVQEDKLDAPTVSNEPISSIAIEEPQAETGEELRKKVAGSTIETTDDIITTEDQKPFDDLFEQESSTARAESSEARNGEDPEEHSNATVPDIRVERDTAEAIAEDEWAPAPSKKGKKGTRSSLADTGVSKSGTIGFDPDATDMSTESGDAAEYIDAQAVPEPSVDKVIPETAEPRSTSEQYSPADEPVVHSDDQTLPVALTEDTAPETQHVHPDEPEDIWSVPMMKEGKKGKKNRKNVGTVETSISESLEPAPSTLSGPEIPGPVEDDGTAEATQEDVSETADEHKTSIHDNPEVTTVDQLEFPSPVPTDVHASEIQMPTVSTTDEQGANWGTNAEDVSAFEAPGHTERSVEAAYTEVPAVSSEQPIPQDSSSTVDPSTQTAEDEWDVPVSKKKKKKGKKGKSSVIEKPSTSAIHSAEHSIDFETSSAENLESYDAGIATPEDEPKAPVPAELEVAEEAGQDEIFSTPLEERTETLSFDTQEFRSPSNDPRFESRSVTPTQADVRGMQSDYGMPMPAEEQVHDTSASWIPQEGHTVVQQSSQEPDEAYNSYTPATLESIVDQTIADQSLVDEATKHGPVETVPSQPEPATESSPEIVQETLPDSESRINHKHQQSFETEISGLAEESILEDPRTHLEPIPKLGFEKEQTLTMDVAEPDNEPEPWSARLSKKDKKKKKKSSLREEQSESSPYLVLKADALAESNQLLEQPQKDNFSRDIGPDAENVPTFSRDLGIESEPVEETSTSKKLSKKEKKKAKKGITSEEASEIQAEPPNDSTLQRRQTEEVFSSTTPAAEDFYTPMESQETEVEPDFAPVKLSKKDKKKAKKKGKTVGFDFSESALPETEPEQSHNIFEPDREPVAEQPSFEEPAFLEEAKIMKNDPTIDDPPSMQIPDPVKGSSPTYQPTRSEDVDIAHEFSAIEDPADVSKEDVSAPKSVLKQPFPEDESRFVDDCQTAEGSAETPVTIPDQSRGIEEPAATKAREITITDLFTTIDQSTECGNPIAGEQGTFTEKPYTFIPHEPKRDNAIEESSTLSEDATNTNQPTIENPTTTGSSLRAGDCGPAGSHSLTEDRSLESSKAHEEIQPQMHTTFEPPPVTPEPLSSEQTTSGAAPTISGEPDSTDHVHAGLSLAECSLPDTLEKGDVKEEALTATKMATLGETSDAEDGKQTDPVVDTHTEAPPDDTFWAPSKLSKKDRKKAKKTKSIADSWPEELGAETSQPLRDEGWSQPNIETTRQEDQLTGGAITEPLETFAIEPLTDPAVELPVKISKKAKRKAKKSQVTESLPWDDFTKESTPTTEPSATLLADEPVQDPRQEIMRSPEQARESATEATEASFAEPVVGSTVEPDNMAALKPTKEPTNDEFLEATFGPNLESFADPVTEAPAGPIPGAFAETSIEPAQDRALESITQSTIEPPFEVNSTSHDLSAEEIRETTPVEEYTPFAPAKLSKKDKKEAKKTKGMQDHVQADDTRERLVVSQAAVSEADPTIQEISFDQLMEHELTPADDLPEAEPESEWGLPTKLSKKDKKKAKKAKPFDEPLEDGEIRGHDEQNRVIEEDFTPAIDPPIQSEQIEPIEGDISRAPVGTAEAAAVTEPDPEDEWTLPRKQSKKDKRKSKKKKNPLNGEEQQHVSPEYTASDNSGTTEDREHLTEASHSAEVPSKPAFDLVNAEEPSDYVEVENNMQSTSLSTAPTDITAQEPDQRIHAPEEPSVIKRSMEQPVEIPEPRAETSQIEEVLEQVPGHPLATDDDTSAKQDLDFAATLAAGLQDSGFDPNLVIDDPIFHRRASPPGAAEADPDEVSSVTTKDARKQGGRSRDHSPFIVPNVGGSLTAQDQRTDNVQSDDFSNALAASLAASGFAPNVLGDMPSDNKNFAEEPEEFSFAISKKKKKGKNGKNASAATSAAIEPEAIGKEHSPSKEDHFLPADAATQSAIGEEPSRDPVNEPIIAAGEPWIESKEAGAVDPRPENEDPVHYATLAEAEHEYVPPVGSTVPRDLSPPSAQVPTTFERPTTPASHYQPEITNDLLASDISAEHVIAEPFDGEVPIGEGPRDGPMIEPESQKLPVDTKPDVPSNIIAKEPEFSVIGKRKNKKDKKSKKIILEGTPDLSGQEPISGLPVTEDLGPAVRSTDVLDAAYTTEKLAEEGKSINEPANDPPSVKIATEGTADVTTGPLETLSPQSTLKRDFGKPSESERPKFFHTSEVSQFLPVAVDDLIRPRYELKEDIQQSGIGIVGKAAMAAMIGAAAMEHNKNDNTPVPESHTSASPGKQDLVEDSQPELKIPHVAEPPTWSFDNLDSNVPSLKVDGDDIVHDRQSQDAGGTGSNPEIFPVPENVPASPVESTTKDRTSYLFQSPPIGTDKRQSAMRSPRQQTVQKQTRFEEPSYPEREIERPTTPPAPLPPSPSRVRSSPIPLPPSPSRTRTPPLPPLHSPRYQAAQKQTRFEGSGYPEQSTERPGTPPAPLPPSPSRVRSPPIPLPPSPRRVPTPVAPLPPSPRPTKLTAITRKKSRDVNDIGSPGPGHSIKSARRTTTSSESFRKGSSVGGPSPTAAIDQTINDGSPFNESRDDVSDGSLRMEKRRGLGNLRTASVLSNRSTSSGNHQMRSSSAASNHSSTLSLRRIDRSLSGDLRAASKRGETPGPKTIPIEPPPTPPLQEEEDGFNGYGNVRTPDMANVYEGWGDVHGSSSISPTRPPSMRKRQSMHILDLEARLEQLASENQQLHDASTTNVSQQHNVNDSAIREALEARDMQLQKKDAEIQQIRAMLEPLQYEIARLTEANSGLNEANKNLIADTNDRYATLQNEQAHAHTQWQQSSRELESLRKQHIQLNSGMEDIVRQEIASALEDKNAEIRKLREELGLASQKIRLLQSEILASKTDNYLTPHDEDYFDTVCQKLCQHVQQWVLRFSKFSDNRMCRLTSDLADEKIEARLDNAILDGSDVDKLLGDRIRRRDVFMSVVMTMIWEYVFTRYLFGMDREQRQKLKSLEKILTEVGPARAVANWRATTLTLLSKRPAFSTQRNLDTEAVAQEIFSTLSALLPPPAQLEVQIMASLRNVLRLAVDLSVEMRTQKAEFIMLPPLQPDYDSQGDLIRKVHFNAALMNERSGEYSSNDELERTQAVVKIVLFPLVVKKGDDVGEGEDEIVVCPAQVLVAGPKNPKKVVRVMSGAMDMDEAKRSKQSLISGLNSENMI